jgi:hypothetical protein
MLGGSKPRLFPRSRRMAASGHFSAPTEPLENPEASAPIAAAAHDRIRRAFEAWIVEG